MSGGAPWYKRGALASQTAYVAVAFTSSGDGRHFAPDFLRPETFSTTDEFHLHRHRRARLDDGDHHRRDRPLGRLDHGAGRDHHRTADEDASATSLAGIPYAVMIVSVIGGLGAAALAGLVNGILIANIRLSPFVTTLGTLSICRGITYVITQGRGQAPTGPQVDTFYALTDGTLFGLPVALVYLLILAVVMGVALRHTRWGRYVFVLGGNERRRGSPACPSTGSRSPSTCSARFAPASRAS